MTSKYTDYNRCPVTGLDCLTCDGTCKLEIEAAEREDERRLQEEREMEDHFRRHPHG